MLLRGVEQKRDSMPRNIVYVKVGLHLFFNGGATKNTVIMQSGVLQADSSRYNRLFLRRFDEPSLKGRPNKWAL